MKTKDIKNVAAAWAEVQESQKAALAKKLAKASASSEKGKAAVTLPKAPFKVPGKNEALDKDDESSVMKVVKALKGAVKAHSGQAKSLEKDIKDSVTKEAMDPVDKKELKGKHSDRKDKDIDNDGDVDASDKFLHKRRKAISKSTKKGKEVVDTKPQLKDDEKDTEMSEGMMDKVRDVRKKVFGKTDAEKRADQERAAMGKFHKTMGMAAKGMTKKKNEEVEQESRRPIFDRIMEKAGNRADHVKGATDPEAIDSKASKGEKDFVAKHGGLGGNDSGIDGAKAAADTAKAAAASVKVAPRRSGDNKSGDMKPIKSTEA